MNTNHDLRDDWAPFVPDEIFREWKAFDALEGCGVRVDGLTDLQLLRAAERHALPVESLLVCAQQVSSLDTVQRLVNMRQLRLALQSEHLPDDALTNGQLIISNSPDLQNVLQVIIDEVSTETSLSSPAVLEVVVRSWRKLDRDFRSSLIRSALYWLCDESQDTRYFGDRKWELLMHGSERVLTLHLESSRTGRRLLVRNVIERISRCAEKVYAGQRFDAVRWSAIGRILSFKQGKYLRRVRELPGAVRPHLSNQALREFPGRYATHPGDLEPMPDPSRSLATHAFQDYGLQQLVAVPHSPQAADSVARWLEGGSYIVVHPNVLPKLHPHILRVIQQRPDVLAYDGSLQIDEAANFAVRDDRSFAEAWKKALLAGPVIPYRLRNGSQWRSTHAAIIVDALEPHLGDNVLARNIAAEIYRDWDGTFADLVATCLAAAE